MITVRISFEKKNEASYISLLDLQRVMQRVLKRSGLPVWHTLGFNPHIYMTFACPLSLGQESECECVDVKTEAEAPDFAQWQTALNAIMPAGIHVTRVAPVEMKADSIAFACYRISYPAAAAAVLEQYNALETAPVEKHSKRGKKIVNLKEHIPQLSYTVLGDTVQLELCLPVAHRFSGRKVRLARRKCQHSAHQVFDGRPAAVCLKLRKSPSIRQNRKFLQDFSLNCLHSSRFCAILLGR